MMSINRCLQVVNNVCMIVVERAPEFSGTRPETDFLWATRTLPYETKHWSKKCMTPDKIPDFLGTRIRLFGIPTRPESDFLLSDLFDTQLFATRSTTIIYVI